MFQCPAWWSWDDTRLMTLWRINLGRPEMRDDTTLAMIYITSEGSAMTADKNAIPTYSEG